ncbi:titin homolog isoform X2 [Polyergus mexicanus]|uniref:titin homolog isoform X2 n=1 Tax=Polyergus mexicanus TaxID=615972 RepID=UPI0038B47293
MLQRHVNIAGVQSKRRAEMSEIEDPQNVSEQDDTQEETAETEEVSNREEVASLTEKSSNPELSEKSSTKESEKEQREEVTETEQEEVKGEIKKEEQEEIKEKIETEASSREESQKEETSDSELAAVTRSASSDDGVPSPGVATEQAEPGEPRVGIPSANIADDGSSGQQCRRVGSGPGVAVGEWNSLPVLVERLREALELSLVTGCRRGGGDEPTATSFAESESSGPDRICARRSLEQALLDGHEDDPEPKKDELKFLEDLLLSDIQTALSRLRETLERTNVATLAKHGGVSDPTSKLHLLRLVSSLLSRLQVPEEKEKTETEVSENGRTLGAQSGIFVASPGRKRRAVRHTIGVSAEEIAHARKQLEERSADLARLNDQVSARRESLLPASRNASSTDRHVEEIHDKYTKDVINQRQSLRDKNKDSREDTGVYLSLIPAQIAYADRPDTVSGESNMHHARRRGSVDSYQEKESDDEETAIRKANEEQSRVTKLAAALRQRAELISANKCNNNNNNKFTAKKSKIKRANTVDIPSYLKLQAQSLDNPGCVLLRRPINVGDKITANVSNLAVPSFHPKTENDKKFLALINRNNEPQAYNAAPAFVKSFGYTKTTDMSSLTNENWNSRFSNIKTAFDKPSVANEMENKLSPKPQPAKRFPMPPQTNKKTPISDKTHNGFPFANASKTKDAGFRHAPSSLFRKIEKTQRPKSPPGYHYQRDNAPPPRNTLREKARIMFDRDSNVCQSQHPAKFNAKEDLQRSSFPRPPWLEHMDKQIENKSSNTVTENGRIDYRLFCKQFAPFVGKNTGISESKTSRNNEESRCNRNEHVAPSSEKVGVVDGKISFRMYPEKESQYRPNESRCVAIEEQADRDKFDHRNEKDTFEPFAMRDDKDLSGSAFAGKAPIDATLRGSSSVAVQTGVHGDHHPEEARVFRVIPRVSGPPTTCNNASVQTYDQPEVESREQWATPRYNDSRYCPAEDSKHFILDHNRNYRIVATDDAPKNETLPLVNKNVCDLVEEDTIRIPDSMEKVPFPATLGYQSPEQLEQIFHTNPQHEDYFSSKPAMDNRSQIHQNYPPYINMDPFQKNQISNVTPREIIEENFSYTNGGALPEEQNIQNQDISADAGVVTRYTCVIATVASTDTPESQSKYPSISEPETLPALLSPLQLRSHPTSNESVTTEEEIRRHNMLQQSLVRRLQNERVMLNDHHVSIANQSANFNQSSDFNPLLNTFNQPSKCLPPEAPKKLELPRRLEPSRRLESPRKLEPLKKPELPKKPEPPKRLEPSKKPKCPPVVTGNLLSVTPSLAFGPTNRVTALRGQYELPPKPGTEQKERSPIPNGAMDPSDEYLVSCANKPSRSIVLSKSESWHQLALSKGSSRPSQIDVSSQPLNRGASYLPKPPTKPKSPSSFKMKKQYEASSSSISVKRMEDKIRMYFDNPTANDSVTETRDSKNRRFSSRDSAKGPIVLSRSRTMPGISDESLRLLIPATQIPAMNLNSAEVDKVFDDIFEEVTKNDDHRF